LFLYVAEITGETLEITEVEIFRVRRILYGNVPPVNVFILVPEAGAAVITR
jgi:hypothetical protein